MNILASLEDRKLAHPPKWMRSNVQMLVISGSEAYGMTQNKSDKDIIGWTMPLKEDCFYIDEIPNFGTTRNRFVQYQEHGIEDKENDKKYDFTVYSIARFFNLAMQANVNVLETLYVPRECVIVSSQLAEKVREQRDLFLSKEIWFRCRGYCFSQLNKINNQEESVKEIRKFEEDHNVPHNTKYQDVINHIENRKKLNGEIVEINLGLLTDAFLAKYKELYDKGMLGDAKHKGSQRFENRKEFQMDCKFASHTVRLATFCEQFLESGTLDMRRDNEMLKDIRRGNWTEKMIRDWFTEKEALLSKLFEKSTIRTKPNEITIKKLLIECLEHHYGSISDIIRTRSENDLEIALKSIRDIANGVSL